MLSFTATSPPMTKKEIGPSLDRPGLVPKIMASVLLEFNCIDHCRETRTSGLRRTLIVLPSGLNPRISPPCRFGYRRRTDVLYPVSFHNSGDGRHEGGEEDRSKDNPLRNARITTPNVGFVVAHGHVTRSACEVSYRNEDMLMLTRRYRNQTPIAAIVCRCRLYRMQQRCPAKAECS